MSNNHNNHHNNSNNQNKKNEVKDSHYTYFDADAQMVAGNKLS